MNTIVATKGRQVIRISIRKDKPTDKELASLVVGPSGNLRAPAVRRGKTLIVGFNDAIYAEEFR